MKLLSTPTATSREFKRLIKSYAYLDWAVAWASIKFEAFDLLRKYRRKIRHLVIGTEFHQTHPDFMQEFQHHPRVRFRLDREGLSGIFHPKVYLFSNSATDWEAVIGSNNFTRAAFTRNIECAVVVGSADESESLTHRHLLNNVLASWNAGSAIDDATLAAYRVRWRANQTRLRAARGHEVKKIREKNVYDCPILNYDWPGYVTQLQQHGNFLAERLEMLTETQAILAAKHSMLDMTIEERKRISGTAPDADIQWRLFGSMAGALDFKRRIKDNDQALSAALDCIPAKGAVVKPHFDDYVRELRKTFRYSKPFQGLAVATRLPCIKRPDYFVCIDGKNKDALFTALGLRPGRVNIDTYWEAVLAPILDSRWWQSSRPAAPGERPVWDARVALLDALFYEP